MSLGIFVANPSANPDDKDAMFFRPAGFESYRTQLWGTQAMRKRSALLYEVKNDLHLRPEQFDEFVSQCRIVRQEEKQIIREIIQSRKPKISLLDWRSRKQKDRSDIVFLRKDLRGYIANFLEAVEFARLHGSDEIDIG